MREIHQRSTFTASMMFWTSLSHFVNSLVLPECFESLLKCYYNRLRKVRLLFQTLCTKYIYLVTWLVSWAHKPGTTVSTTVSIGCSFSTQYYLRERRAQNTPYTYIFTLLLHCFIIQSIQFIGFFNMKFVAEVIPVCFDWNCLKLRHNMELFSLCWQSSSNKAWFVMF